LQKADSFWKVDDMMTITKEFTFDAAHRLHRPDLTESENRDIYGKCCTLHGHTYRLQVCVSGVIDASGMILHFSDLKQVVKEEIITRYDHSFLNDLSEYRNCPTTAENMVRHIFNVLEPGLKRKTVTLESVTLFETPTSWATFSKNA
jgi:6-pyruvoyltetrahydropterin/6-carboxytetrahydropterin synthase